MAVLCESYSVVVRREAIDRRFVGGWKGFVNKLPNSSMCTDEELVRVGFLDPDLLNIYVNSLIHEGLIYEIDIVIVDQNDGPIKDCDWIQFSKTQFEGGEHEVSMCWLWEGHKPPKGSIILKDESFVLATPMGWSPGGIKHGVGIDNLKFLRSEGGLDIYWDEEEKKEVFTTKKSKNDKEVKNNKNLLYILLLLISLILLFFFIQTNKVWSMEKSEILSNEMCDGLPAVPVDTMEGFCMGLVAQGFEFPRGVLPLSSKEILVVDMGRGWARKKGSLWRVVKEGDTYRKTRILRNLDQPHAIVKSPSGLIYLASIDRVSILEMGASSARLVDVIGGDSGLEPLPVTGRHPLKQLAFDSVGNLFINIGSASDNCELPDKKKGNKRGVCKEATGLEQRGAIRKYRITPNGGFNRNWEIYASGLRNSMGMVFDPLNQALWQVESSRDAISKYDPKLDDRLLPHDELNLIEKGNNYGWPYCYDLGIPSPEYPQYNCSFSKKPVLLLPAHSTPLGMAFHDSRYLPKSMQRGLFVTLNGYRSTGQRIIYIPFNNNGMPKKKILNVVSGWNKSNGLPKGAPVDIRVSDDGALFISDDRNGNLLRLIYIGP